MKLLFGMITIIMILGSGCAGAREILMSETGQFCVERQAAIDVIGLMRAVYKREYVKRMDECRQGLQSALYCGKLNDIHEQAIKIDPYLQAKIDTPEMSLDMGKVKGLVELLLEFAP